MGRIRVLSDAVIDRIAAGEVVERPASVIKELVENAIDAGAATIDVRIASGGRRSIEVTDDGCGMDRDDALLALERHATSKLADVTDLERIATLGFRGEALSSIAAVSRLTLRTAPADGEGTEVVVHAGRIVDVRPGGFPRGTHVAVERLFANVPARRKFLRSDATEVAHVVRWCARYALAHPGRGFRLTSEGRELLVAPPADPGERAGQVLGADLSRRLLPVDGTRESMRVSGWVGRPVDSLPSRAAQHWFVNGRAVADRVLAHAVTEAFGHTMPPGRHPALCLFLDIDPALVDVNVHPQKLEVRFRSSSSVHDLARDAIRQALARSEAVPALADLRPQAPSARAEAVREATLGYLARSAPGASALAPRPPAVPPRRTPAPDASAERGSAPASVRPEEPRVLAQYRRGYIVAEDGDGLVLIDQHAAHERVLFEQFRRQADENRIEVQRLLVPVTVELGPHEIALLEEEGPELARLGFHVEPFGAGAVRIDAVPALAARIDPETLLRELLGEAARARSAAGDVAALARRLVVTAACKAAVKLNDPLTVPAMERLVADLWATGSPTTCPHGRPVVFRLAAAEIERAFRRR
jgi:DNA mismatch repair protein MutL